MNKRLLPTLIAITIVGLVLASCGGSAADSPEEPSDGQGDRLDPPEEYAGITNPFQGDSEAVTEGESLYQSNCYSCHGEEARGNGPAAAALEPKPPDLVASQDEMSDDYLHWRIAEGGMMRPFNSVMPAWKGILSEDQIWKIITYLRTLQG
jgi:mono/diheme cytochrome c family protein